MKWNTLKIVETCCLILACVPALWSSPAARQWIGPDYMAMPLHDWSVQRGYIIAEPGKWGARTGPAQMGIRLNRTTRIVKGPGEFRTAFSVKLERPGKGTHRAGIWLGLKSRTPSPQNVWTRPDPQTAIFVGVNQEGTLIVDDQKSSQKFGPDQEVHFEILARLDARHSYIDVYAQIFSGQRIELHKQLAPDALLGYMCLSASGHGSSWRFMDWKLVGNALEKRVSEAVGPIIWTQYTLSRHIVKLQAQMVPLESDDNQQVILQFRQGGRWGDSHTAKIEPFSSTALFKIENWDDQKPADYRVKYNWLGRDYFWYGTIRANPVKRDTFTMAAFTGDHGELFPQNTLVNNVRIQNPDLLFFSGDQIYEQMDKVNIIRKPLEGARLSYLGKWYEFGLTWRSMLNRCPSVILPDDHDVFMGNVWGDSGRGYIMQPEWVNMVQRTQTASLPDPVDPAPVERGIGVYFTRLDYAGMSFAVIEDRKFKSDPKIIKGKSFKMPAKDFDVPGAVLLGDRQLKFLTEWNKDTRSLPVRWFLSQTMLAKATTHAGPTLKRMYRSVDAGGWPQSGRNRALRTLDRDVIMVHGDQHIGMLARMGIDTWDDGPVAFMVVGSSVGYPRAWWPRQKPQGGEINGPYTGRYIDDMGNYITVLGVNNPQPLPPGVTDAYNRPDLIAQGPFAIQAAKGSGHGLIIVDKKKKTARFEAWHINFDAAHPTPSDQFKGFPYTIKIQR